METSLDILLEKMTRHALTEEEAKLLEEKARKFSNLEQLAEARNEWREAMRKYFDAKAKASGSGN
ncbi:MAG: hypothetical protein FJZ78_08570 [Bacteroidetes bacterium]|nr:hypothetical protein [Bacteroidota bacterium]